MNHWLRNSLLMVLMLAASAGAVALRPSHRIADQGPKIDLQAMIPTSFGEWREEQQPVAQIVDPQGKELLDEIYSQLVSRTYVNIKGYRIMLSIAYGSEQTRVMQVHRPEVCYAAQGFRISHIEKITIEAADKTIPAMRLNTQLEQRNEPVTYWVRIGNSVVRGNLEQGFARALQGLSGYVTDGLLFRVSSIDTNSAEAYKNQETFIKELLASIPTKDRSTIIGELAAQ